MDKEIERERERVCVRMRRTPGAVGLLYSQSLIYSVSQRKSLHIPKFPQLLLQHT